MKTINDMLTVHGGMSRWAMWMNEKERILGDITRRRATRIPVTQQYRYTTDVSVQVLADDILVYCNHANKVEGTRTAFTSLGDDYEKYAIECAKDNCNYAEDREGDWYE